jgi:hypothetical protein
MKLDGEGTVHSLDPLPRHRDMPALPDTTARDEGRSNFVAPGRSIVENQPPSHLIQAFDIAVTAPFKIQFTRRLGKRFDQAINADPIKREDASLPHEIILEACLDSQ